jgi:hypothetical protein
MLAFRAKDLRFLFIAVYRLHTKKMRGLGIKNNSVKMLFSYGISDASKL